jgi:O-antigen ligase
LTASALDPQAGPFSRPFAAPHVRPLGHIERGFMWLIGFSGGFVVIEPAPYEFIIAVAAVLFFAGGMSLRPSHLPLLVLLSLCNIGYLIGVTPVVSENGTVIWTAVSCFMSASALFFALAMGEDTARRLDLLLKGYVAVAVAVSLLGIAAYSHLLPDSDIFLFAQRSRATFKDPNVLGAFLVLPAVLTLQRMMLGRLRDLLAGGLMTLVISIELLLAFSRGAWAATGVAVALALLISFLVSNSPKERLRIVVIAAAGAAMVAVVIIAVISIPQVRDLFQERASLIQSYDAGRFGRFGRHILGAEVALDHPFGIGPLQFAKMFPEDPHNSILDAFMAGGWLSGAAWLALIIVTLLAGLRFAFVDAPWRRAYVAVYASFVALTAESYIIDVEHWRHYFLLIGALWGLFIAPATRASASGSRIRPPTA